MGGSTSSVFARCRNAQCENRCTTMASLVRSHGPAAARQGARHLLPVVVPRRQARLFGRPATRVALRAQRRFAISGVCRFHRAAGKQDRRTRSDANDVMKALVFSAGRGERMRPLSDTTPKPLLKAGGKRLIEWHLQAVARAGVREVVINTSHLASQIAESLGDGARFGVRIEYS